MVDNVDIVLDSVDSVDIMLDNVDIVDIPAPNDSPDGVEAGAEQPEAVCELGGHRQQSVGHIGPQNILTCTMYMEGG